MDLLKEDILNVFDFCTLNLDLNKLHVPGHVFDGELRSSSDNRHTHYELY